MKEWISMANMKVEYKGDKRCELVHEASNTVIYTDAPVDNSGKGESFSPTDLMSSSLGACMLTIMAIQLEPLGMSLKGSFCNLKKHMLTSPRRVGKIEIDLNMCAGISNQFRDKVAEIARTCPVQFSINPEIQVVLNINYPD
jgi:uncharacterized OsmC-like protein